MNNTRRLFLLALFGAIAALTLLWLLQPPQEAPLSAAGFSPQAPPVKAEAGASVSVPVTDLRASRAVQSVAARDSVSDTVESGVDDDRFVEPDAETLLSEHEGLQAVASETTAPSSSDGTEVTERPDQWCLTPGYEAGGAWHHLQTADEGTTAEYFLGSDSAVVWSGSRSVALRTNPSRPNSAVVWQAVDATPYRGSRIKLSAHMSRTPHEASLFLRVDNAEGPPEVKWAFGEAWLEQQSPQMWTNVAVVLDVPDWAVVLYYGAAIHHGGSLWLDDVRLEKVDKQSLTEPSSPTRPSIHTPTFWPFVPRALLPAPSNLDFESTTDDEDAGGGCSVAAA
jgi:hypothetical protein